MKVCEKTKENQSKTQGKNQMLRLSFFYLRFFALFHFEKVMTQIIFFSLQHVYNDSKQINKYNNTKM